MKTRCIFIGIAILMSSYAMSQIRPSDQSGINVFENPKGDFEKFDGIKVKIGGAFTQSWQNLNHSNKTNSLIPIKPGFNTANANLNFNVALDEGVDLKMDMFLSSRHHYETWVKGGYLQFNKIPFIKSDFIDNIMKFTTLKFGHMEINYGDAHFRRSDNGNSIYNPFIENYIMDGYATEIGLEADFQSNGFIGVLGITNGEIKGDISAVDSKLDSASYGERNPSYIIKLGYDKKITDKFRMRLTASGYITAGSYANTLYGGDRGGSHYFGVIENSFGTSAAFSGRFDPKFSDKISSFMGNLFLRYDALDWLKVESFTTLETSSGRSKVETWGDRSANQFATDLVLRLGNNENFWLGGRYNKVNSALYPSTKPFNAYNINIDRLAICGGWFMTKNVMAKIEYTNQKYNGFTGSDLRNEAKFNGVVFEAVVGF